MSGREIRHNIVVLQWCKPSLLGFYCGEETSCPRQLILNNFNCGLAYVSESMTMLVKSMAAGILVAVVVTENLHPDPGKRQEANTGSHVHLF